ncbi:unnamed protein product [Trichogramma brassicae]|uniref:C2H2-type domain-containing protein n=1 Tax=Trichogramma brassicae TaxID=86971 RepID=A0A6H5IBN6_9HYME|nr:unnamed protein product [Trichogramma brassicae]
MDLSGKLSTKRVSVQHRSNCPVQQYSSMLTHSPRMIPPNLTPQCLPMFIKPLPKTPKASRGTKKAKAPVEKKTRKKKTIEPDIVEPPSADNSPRYFKIGCSIRKHFFFLFSPSTHRCAKRFGNKHSLLLHIMRVYEGRKDYRPADSIDRRRRRARSKRVAHRFWTRPSQNMSIGEFFSHVQLIIAAHWKRRRSDWLMQLLTATMTWLVWIAAHHYHTNYTPLRSDRFELRDESLHMATLRPTRLEGAHAVYYAPKNDFTDGLMRSFREECFPQKDDHDASRRSNLSVSVKGFASETELLKAYRRIELLGLRDPKRPTSYAGVIFAADVGEASKALHYKIQSGKLTYDRLFYEQTDWDSSSGDDYLTRTNRILSTQTCLDASFIKLKTSNGSVGPNYNKLKKYKKAIIVSTDSMSEAEVISDRIAVLTSGQLECYGTPKFLKERYAPGACFGHAARKWKDSYETHAEADYLRNLNKTAIVAGEPTLEDLFSE